jgi:molybdate transport system substrate-binding protein
MNKGPAVFSGSRKLGPKSGRIDDLPFTIYKWHMANSECKADVMNTSRRRVMLTVFLVTASALSIVLVTDCGRKPAANRQDELVVLCGNSFVQPAEQLCAEFRAKTGIPLTSTVAGSEDFLPLVKTGQKGDILITHDPYLDYVRDANALADSVQVGFVAPVLAVQPGNPKSIRSIQDLAQPGLRVALTDPQYSTCGEMVFALLEKKGIKDAVMANVGNRLAKGHSTLGNFLKTQVVDAVILWNGVAYTFKDSLEIIKTPYEYDQETRVHIIALGYSKHPEALKKFMEFARRRGPEIFAAYGYVK